MKLRIKQRVVGFALSASASKSRVGSSVSVIVAVCYLLRKSALQPAFVGNSCQLLALCLYSKLFTEAVYSSFTGLYTKSGVIYFDCAVIFLKALFFTA